MAKQALRLRKIPHGIFAAVDDRVGVEDHLRRTRLCHWRDGAAEYAAVPALGQTLCGAKSSLLRSRLARFRDGRTGDGSLRNWMRCAQNAGSRHA
jgi:hypothetical protein